MTVINTLIKVKPEKCKMIGPFKCPYCGGHISFDVDHLENSHPICPYCYLVLKIPPYERK